MHYILIANYGNHSLAALQYLIERQLESVHVIYVDTGWAASEWPARVESCSAYARQHQINVHHIKALASFSQMVKDRRQFPSSKFQWCAGFLKGMALLDKLDAIDPFCEATIVSGKRRLDSKRFSELQEYIEEDDYFDGRRLWHPLWQTNALEFKNFIKRTGFEFLPHPSRECHPCIHASEKDLGQLEAFSLERLEKLEQQTEMTMFEKPVRHYAKGDASNPLNKPSDIKQFDLGCGSPWCCGE